MLQLKFNLDGDEQLSLLLGQLESATDAKAILDEAGALAFNRIRTRFLSTENPEGQKWPESKAAKRRAKNGRGGGTLYDTGKLYQSLQLSNVNGGGRRISTDVPYAGFVNYGTIKLPERIFMGLSDGDVELIDLLIIKRIEKALV